MPTPQQITDQLARLDASKAADDAAQAAKAASAQALSAAQADVSAKSDAAAKSDVQLSADLGALQALLSSYYQPGGTLPAPTA